jgi:sugar lactone lactonase YvrE
LAVSIWRVQSLVARADVLGEGPYWCSQSRRLWWLDVMDSELCSLDPASGALSVTRTEHKVHALARCAFPWFICTAHVHGLAWLNVETGQLRPLRDPENGKPTMLLNDARCDAAGRFWFGSMHKKGAPEGSLYSLDGALTLKAHHHGVGTANGMAFSPDGRWLYFIDTYYGILRFAVETPGDRLGPPTLLLDAKLLQGWPDGMTIDSDGCLWVALAHGGAVLRVTPAGKIDATLGVPARFVTSCTFGGDDLGTLFVTSATLGRSPEELAAYPQSGALFAIDTGYKGLAEAPFRATPPASA